MQDLRILYQEVNQDVVIGLSASDAEQINLQFNSFYNWGATDGDLHWTNEGFGGKYFAYFWTDKHRLAKYFFDSSMNILAGKPEMCSAYKKKREGFKAEIRKLAAERASKLIKEDFMTKTVVVSESFMCNIGHGDAND